MPAQNNMLQIECEQTYDFILLRQYDTGSNDGLSLFAMMHDASRRLVSRRPEQKLST